MTNHHAPCLKELQQVHRAALALFGPQDLATREFWARLDLPRVKRAFRDQAKRCHPDTRSPANPREVQEIQAQFVALKGAYDVLRTFLDQRTRQSHGKPRRESPVIIAVAASKGGVGASVVAVNVGVVLARREHRVVLADLDPDGPTLPLYLGNARRPLPHRGGPTPGPDLTNSLASSRFGPAWLSVSELDLSESAAATRQRWQTFQALRRLAADCVICDLGRGAAAGVLDFFLWAHQPVLVTTPEPAACLKALHFLKAAWARRSAAFAPCPPGLQRGRLRTWQKQGVGTWERIFSPVLLVNQVRRQEQGRRVIQRLAEAALPILGPGLRPAMLPYREEISYSTQDLVPAAARFPDGPVGRPLDHLGKLLLS